MTSLAARAVGEFAVLEFSPQLTQNDYLNMRQYVAERFFEQGKTRLLLDCEAVSVFPSIAFGVFCSLARDARRLKGSCSLVHVSRANREILARTHMDRQIGMYFTIQEALDAIAVEESEPEAL